MKPSTRQFFLNRSQLVLRDIFLLPVHDGNEQNKEWRPESVGEHCARDTSCQNSTNNNYPNHVSPRNTLNTLHKILKLVFGVLACKNRSGRGIAASMAVGGAGGDMNVMFFVGRNDYGILNLRNKERKTAASRSFPPSTLSSQPDSDRPYA